MQIHESAACALDSIRQQICRNNGYLMDISPVSLKLSDYTPEALCCPEAADKDLLCGENLCARRNHATYRSAHRCISATSVEQR